jgi:Type I restriction enzyme R protein N terminus (HSDR_N)
LSEQINFQNFNETDVREEVLAPLLRALGYRSGSEHNVVREQSLRYPRVFLGRKNVKKDPILRGKADYILEAGSKVRWIVEAKSPEVEIDFDSIDQAYTYANHPEIRAVYFVLCNGKRFVVFQTNLGPDAKSLLDLSFEEMQEKHQIIDNLLSPNSILRDHPTVVRDVGAPIGKGLRSVVRITNGVISYSGNSVNLPALTELQTGISGGAVERNENGEMIAYLTTVAPTRSMQLLNQRLGLTSFEMISKDKYISNDSKNPTVFIGDQTVVLPAGERLLDINSWQEVVIPTNIVCKVKTQASGYLEGNRFHGDFFSIMHYQNVNRKINMHGKYEIYVA